MRANWLEAKTMKMRKATGDASLHGGHVGAQAGGQVAAVERDGGAEQGEDQNPQQHGALVVPPHAGDLVAERLLGVPHTFSTEKSEVT
jgi:hypothetical protein